MYHHHAADDGSVSMGFPVTADWDEKNDTTSNAQHPVWYLRGAVNDQSINTLVVYYNSDNINKPTMVADFEKQSGIS